MLAAEKQAQYECVSVSQSLNIIAPGIFGSGYPAIKCFRKLNWTPQFPSPSYLSPRMLTDGGKIRTPTFKSKRHDIIPLATAGQSATIFTTYTPRYGPSKSLSKDSY